MFDEVIKNKLLKANAVIGIFKANSDNEDIHLVDENNKPLITFNMLRQQLDKKGLTPNYCLSDFIAPQEVSTKRKQDYFGCFAVTAGIDIEGLVEAFDKDHDDYNSIMIKSVADRLAEAFAELMHHKVRSELWGYQTVEFKNEDLITEKYQGIRPAPGYPSCPEHSEKEKIWQLLDVKNNIGMVLTESYAMLPTASVSGFYLAHEDAKYFGVSKINEQQVKSYAKRKNIDEVLARRLLNPVI